MSILSALPTAEELKRLSLRAIVAYAFRAACRVRPMLRDSVEDEIIEKALSFGGQIVSAESFDHLNIAQAVDNMADITAATIELEPLALRIAARSIRLVAWGAYMVLNVIDSASSSERRLRDLERAAKASAAAGRAVCALDEPFRSRAIAATRRDYETLLKEFGVHEEGQMGEPIDASEKGILGPLF